ncbi:E3 ubiquitin-protein ligase [Musa troglodytarum]|nr:E3 ubiquitin-protein ligase [Musa troglodytarum]
MESDNIECISVSDGLADDDEVARVSHPLLKPHGDGGGTVIDCAVASQRRLLICYMEAHPELLSFRFSGWPLAVLTILQANTSGDPSYVKSW